MTTALALRNVELDRYVAEIKQYPLLSRDEEQSLAHRYLKDGDLSAAHELVVSNLRFVVKVAHEPSRRCIWSRTRRALFHLWRRRPVLDLRRVSHFFIRDLPQSAAFLKDMPILAYESIPAL